ncbi:YmfQ family protein [Fictibacillus sp. Mic-4]|uniref:YmfQ family protein n=1 Tax=Fictibacillus sp. Mic-4 TaxID=3132826 RepID=UPI003CFB80B9
MQKRDLKYAMHSYLPNYYEEIREANTIIDVESMAIEQLNSDIQDVLNQFFVDTATWGLANWESLCGIPTDESKPYDQRRSVIKSKIRGIGTVTVSLIKNVAESYANGGVTVTEDSENYTIKVKFVGKLGIPPNIDDIKNVLREIIPAHLVITYEFTFLTYDQAKVQFASYDAMLAKTYDDVLNGR